MIDMYEKSKKLIIKLGYEKSGPLFLHLKPGENLNFTEGVADNTHFSEKGALTMASLFLEGLREQEINSLTEEIK
jgi:hypothetical protein